MLGTSSLGRSASAGTLRIPADTGVRSRSSTTRWVSAGGTGGYHYQDVDDGVTMLHEQSEERKWNQRRRLDAEHRALRILEHSPAQRQPTGAASKMLPYDINGKLLAACRAQTPQPEQTSKAHWLCQVNSMTGSYNIVNNLPLHSHLVNCRQQELQALNENSRSTLPAAGKTQPQRDISSYDIPGFVPTKQPVQRPALQRCL